MAVIDASASPHNGDLYSAIAEALTLRDTTESAIYLPAGGSNQTDPNIYGDGTAFTLPRGTNLYGGTPGMMDGSPKVCKVNGLMTMGSDPLGTPQVRDIHFLSGATQLHCRDGYMFNCWFGDTLTVMGESYYGLIDKCRWLNLPPTSAAIHGTGSVNSHTVSNCHIHYQGKGIVLDNDGNGDPNNWLILRTTIEGDGATDAVLGAGIDVEGYYHTMIANYFERGASRTYSEPVIRLRNTTRECNFMTGNLMNHLVTLQNDVQLNTILERTDIQSLSSHTFTLTKVFF